MTTKKKLLFIGVVAAICIALVTFLPGGIRGKSLGSSVLKVVQSSTDNDVIAYVSTFEQAPKATAEYIAAIDADGAIYAIVDAGAKHNIIKYSSQWAYIGSFDTAAPGDTKPFRPSYMAIGKDGRWYVVDTPNDRIRIFTAAWVPTATFGSPRGTGDGKLKDPHSIAIDSVGNIYVADTGNNRIQKFSPEGVYMLQFGVKWQGDGQLNYPMGIIFDPSDPSGDLIVSDVVSQNTTAPVYTYRLQKFSAEWVYKSTFSSKLGMPWVIDTRGTWYLSHYDKNNAISTDRFDSLWNFLGNFKAPSIAGVDTTGDTTVTFANTIVWAVDASGNMYVTGKNGVILKFSQTFPTTGI